MLKDPCNKCGDPFDFTCYLIDVDTFGIICGVVLIIGSVVSYVPQILKLCKTKSVEGLSLQLLQIAVYNQYFQLCNYYMAQFPQVASCQNDFEKCMQNIMPEISIVICYFGFIIPYAQAIFYLFKAEKHSKTFKIQFLCFVIHLGVVILTFPAVLSSAIFVSTCNQVFNSFLLCFAIMSTVCACIQYLPQIYKTWKLKAAGSLSIVGQAIQVPGGMVSLATLITSGNNITNLITVIVVLILQSILLVMLVVFECCQPWKGRRHQLINEKDIVDSANSVNSVKSVEEGKQEQENLLQ